MNINKFINQFEKMMCSLIAMVAMFSVGGCRTVLYQPEEPTGLEEFAKRNKILNNNIKD